MKISKKIIALILLMAFSFSLTVFAVSEDKVWLKVSGLGIMTTDESGSYRENDPVTRAEFSAITSRILRMESFPMKSAFADVSDEHWANGYIMPLYSMGIISGMGNGIFAPEMPVSYPQALKMIVSALGYKESAETSGGYPDGYVAVAAKLGITKNVSIQDAQKLTRGDVAKLIYNSLEVYPLVSYDFSDYVKEDRKLGDLLEEWNDTVKFTGIVKESFEASIEEIVPKLEDDQVKIGDNIFYSDFDVKVGYYAEVYAKETIEGYEIVNVVYPSLRNSLITASAKDASIVGNTLKYLSDDNKRRECKISDNAFYMYNGRKTTDFKTINFGTYGLLDNNGDNIADVVFMNEPESFIIKRVNTNNGMIYFERTARFRGRNGMKLTFEEDEEKTVILKDKDNNSVNFEEIEAGNAITFIASEDLSYIEAVLSKDKVEGKITEIAEKSLFIDGNEYGFSSADGIRLGSELELADSGVFVLDAYGDVVGIYGEKSKENYVLGYCITNEGAKSIGQSGHLIQIISSSAPRKEVKISGDDEIISYYFQNNDPVIYECAKKVMLNDEKIDASEIADSSLEECLVAIKLNSEGKVSEIYYEPVSRSDRSNYTFNADIMSFGGEMVTRGFVTNESTAFVCVPQKVNPNSDDFMVQVKLTDGQENCKVVGEVFFPDSSYSSVDVQPVDILLIKGVMDSSSAPVPSSSDDVCITGKINATLGTIRDDAGEYVYKLEILNGTTLLHEVTASSGIAFDAAKSLKKGDLVRYVKDGFGRITNIKKICSIQGLGEDYNSHIYTQSGVETGMYGLIYSSEADVYDYFTNEYVDKLVLSFDGSGSDSDISNELKIKKKNGPPVYHYNRSTGWITPGSLDDVVASEYAGSSASKAFVLMASNDVSAVVIIED